MPTVYHGIPDPNTPHDTRAVNDALQAIVAIMNGLPQHLVPRVVCSILTSTCCAQIDPIAAFHTIGANVADAIEAHMTEPEGSA